jgi:hypothetical protein
LYDEQKSRPIDRLQMAVDSECQRGNLQLYLRNDRYSKIPKDASHMTRPANSQIQFHRTDVGEIDPTLLLPQSDERRKIQLPYWEAMNGV